MAVSINLGEASFSSVLDLSGIRSGVKKLQAEMAKPSSAIVLHLAIPSAEIAKLSNQIVSGLSGTKIGDAVGGQIAAGIAKSMASSVGTIGKELAKQEGLIAKERVKNEAKTQRELSAIQLAEEQKRLTAANAAHLKQKAETEKFKQESRKREQEHQQKLKEIRVKAETEQKAAQALEAQREKNRAAARIELAKKTSQTAEQIKEAEVQKEKKRERDKLERQIANLEREIRNEKSAQAKKQEQAEKAAKALVEQKAKTDKLAADNAIKEAERERKHNEEIRVREQRANERAAEKVIAEYERTAKARIALAEKTAKELAAANEKQLKAELAAAEKQRQLDEKVAKERKALADKEAKENEARIAKAQKEADAARKAQQTALLKEAKEKQALADKAAKEQKAAADKVIAQYERELKVRIDATEKAAKAQQAANDKAIKEAERVAEAKRKITEREAAAEKAAAEKAAKEQKAEVDRTIAQYERDMKARLAADEKAAKARAAVAEKARKEAEAAEKTRLAEIEKQRKAEEAAAAAAAKARKVEADKVIAEYERQMKARLAATEKAAAAQRAADEKLRKEKAAAAAAEAKEAERVAKAKQAADEKAEKARLAAIEKARKEAERLAKEKELSDQREAKANKAAADRAIAEYERAMKARLVATEKAAKAQQAADQKRAKEEQTEADRRIAQYEREMKARITATEKAAVKIAEAAKKAQRELDVALNSSLNALTGGGFGKLAASSKVLGSEAGKNFLAGIGQYQGPIGAALNFVGPKWTAAIVTGLNAMSPTANKLFQIAGTSGGQNLLSQLTQTLTSGAASPGLKAALSNIGAAGGKNFAAAFLAAGATGGGGIIAGIATVGLKLGGSFLKAGGQAALGFMETFSEGVLRLGQSLFQKLGALAGTAVKGAIGEVDSSVDLAGTIDLNSSIASQIAGQQALARGESGVNPETVKKQFIAQASELGASPELIVTPGQVAEAQKLLATSGRDASFISNSLKKIIQIANITQTDLKTTTGNILDITSTIDFGKGLTGTKEEIAKAKGEAEDRAVAQIFGAVSTGRVKLDDLANTLKYTRFGEGDTKSLNNQLLLASLQAQVGLRGSTAGTGSSAFFENIGKLTEVRGFDNGKLKFETADGAKKTEVELLAEVVKLFNAAKANPQSLALAGENVSNVELTRRFEADVKKALDSRGLNYLTKLATTDIGNSVGSDGRLNLLPGTGGDVVGAGAGDKTSSDLALAYEFVTNPKLLQDLEKLPTTATGYGKRLLEGSIESVKTNIGFAFAPVVDSIYKSFGETLQNVIGVSSDPSNEKLTGDIARAKVDRDAAVLSGDSNAIAKTTIALEKLEGSKAAAQTWLTFTDELKKTFISPTDNPIANAVDVLIVKFQPLINDLIKKVGETVLSVVNFFRNPDNVEKVVERIITGARIIGTIFDVAGKVFNFALDTSSVLFSIYDAMTGSTVKMESNFGGMVGKAKEIASYLFPSTDALKSQFDRFATNATQSESAKATGEAAPGIGATLLQGFLGGLGGAGAQFLSENGANLSLFGTRLLQIVVSIASFLGQALGLLIRVASVILSVVMPPLNAVLGVVSNVVALVEGGARVAFTAMGGALELLGTFVGSLQDKIFGPFNRQMSQAYTGISFIASAISTKIYDFSLKNANALGAFINKIWNDMGGGFGKVVNGIWKGVKWVLDGIGGFFFGTSAQAATVGESIGGSAGAAAGDSVSKSVGTATTGIFEQVVEKARSVFSAIPKIITDYYTAPFKLGIQAVNLYWDTSEKWKRSTMEFMANTTVPFLKNATNSAIAGVSSFWGKTWEWIRGTIAWLANTTVPFLKNTIINTISAVSGFWQKTWEWIRSTISWLAEKSLPFLKNAALGMISGISGFWQKTWEWVRSTISWLVTKSLPYLQNAGKSTIEFIGGVWDRTSKWMKTTFTDLASSLEKAFKPVMDWFSSTFKSAFDYAKGILGSAGGGIGGGDFGSIFGGTEDSVRSDVGGGFLATGGGKLGKQAGANANKVAEILRAKGFTETQIAGALVNAVAESGLNAEAIGDGGHSVGIFQLNDWGAGAGMSVAERKDVTTNTNAILRDHGVSEFLRLTKGMTDVSQAAALWSKLVERPGDAEGAARDRAELARKYFPNNTVPTGSGLLGSLGNAYNTVRDAVGKLFNGAVTLFSSGSGGSSTTAINPHHDYEYDKQGRFVTDFTLENSNGQTRGVPVPAPLGGTIVKAGDYGDGYGNSVDIDTGNGIILIGHLDSVAVRVGQKISAGTVVGGQGSTGHSTGDHVHMAGPKEAVIGYINALRGKGTGGGDDLLRQGISLAGGGGRPAMVEVGVPKPAEPVSASSQGAPQTNIKPVSVTDSKASVPIVQQELKSYEQALSVIRSYYSQGYDNFDTRGLSFGFVDNQGSLPSNLSLFGRGADLAEALKGYSTEKKTPLGFSDSTKLLDKQIEDINDKLTENKEIDQLATARDKVADLQRSLEDAKKKREYIDANDDLSYEEFQNKSKQRRDSIEAQLAENRRDAVGLYDRYGLKYDPNAYDTAGKNNEEFKAIGDELEVVARNPATTPEQYKAALDKAITRLSTSNVKGDVTTLRRLLLLRSAALEYSSASKRYTGLDRDKQLSALSARQFARFGTYLEGTDRSIAEKEYTIKQLETDKSELETNLALDRKQFELAKKNRQANSDITIRNLEDSIAEASKDLKDLETKINLQRQLEKLKDEKEAKEAIIGDSKFKQIEAYLRSRGYDPTYEDVLKIYRRAEQIASEEEVLPSKLDENVRKALFQAGLFGVGSQVLGKAKELTPTSSVYDLLSDSLYGDSGFGGIQFGGDNTVAGSDNSLDITGGSLYNKVINNSVSTRVSGGGGAKTVAIRFDGIDPNAMYSGSQIKQLEQFINNSEFMDMVIDGAMERLQYDVIGRTTLGIR